MSRTRIYGAWKSMVGRCRNPNHSAYKNYGARGITVCDRWLEFEHFYSDMGDRPKGMSIDRLDNNGNYEPDNCRWATRKQQNLNKGLYRKNSSGLSGVSRRWGKWCVAIKRDSVERHLGMTDDFFEACCMRKSAELNYSG